LPCWAENTLLFDLRDQTFANQTGFFRDKNSLISTIDSLEDENATSRITRRKGPVPKRRYQEGLFKKENGNYYSFFYRDRAMQDGTTRSVYTRIHLGKVGEVSELSARREHDRLRQQINRERGSVPTAPKGETFEEVAKTYMKDIAPLLSPSTER
jgi:hypothetical protein